MRFSVDLWRFTLPCRFADIFHRNRLGKFSVWNYPLNVWRPVFTGAFRNRWMGDRQMQALIAALQGNLPEERTSRLATSIDGRKAMEVVLGVYRSTEKCKVVHPEDIDIGP